MNQDYDRPFLPIEKQALLDRIADLEKRIEKLEKKNERL